MTEEPEPLKEKEWKMEWQAFSKRILRYNSFEAIGKNAPNTMPKMTDEDERLLDVEKIYEARFYNKEDVKAAIEWLLEELANDKESMFILEDDRGRKYFTQQMIKIMDKIKEAFPDIMEGKE